MLALLCFVLAVLTSPFKSKSRLEAENAALRHQLVILRRKVRGQVKPTNNDRCFLVQLYRWFPSILQVVTIIQPETIVRWHRAGFRFYWRWKSRPRGGRPQIEADLRALIRRMNIEIPLWGAPRIHGGLLKLGFEIAQSSVHKYMVKRHGPMNNNGPTLILAGMSLREMLEVVDWFITEHADRDEKVLATIAATRAKAAVIIRASFADGGGEAGAETSKFQCVKFL